VIHSTDPYEGNWSLEPERGTTICVTLDGSDGLCPKQQIGNALKDKERGGMAMRIMFRGRSGSGMVAVDVGVARGTLCVLLLAAILVGLVAPGAARAKPLSTNTAPIHGPELGYSLTPSKTKPYALCEPNPKYVQCMTIVDPLVVKTASGYRVDGTGPLLEGGGEEKGLDPENLQSAYKIPTKGGSTETVAVVDAYRYKEAESDLAVYRERYKLSACKEGCFKKVAEEGKEITLKEEEAREKKEKEEYEKANEKEKEEKKAEAELAKGWTVETALDLDMVSAACPECHILLVEATEPSMKDLAAAAEEAYKLGANEISNSYGTPEDDPETCPNKEGCKEYLSDYDHPGVPITVASGDSGSDDSVSAPSWPASSPNVIAVGGTTLTKESNSRGWKEGVWRDSGSGCSLVESKPTWQTDWGCAKRTDNDTAAVADNKNSPVSIYNTPYFGGYADLGGTSVATPLVAGIEAHASSTIKDEGAEAFYRTSLFDVTLKNNGLCDPPADEYLCTGEEGYNGPAGWGAPDGPLEVAQTYQAVTGEATGVKEQKATLNGYVYPNGVKTTYKFEYGKTVSYGKTVTVSGSSSSVVWQSVSGSVSGLEPEVTYHYRLVANNGTETKDGADRTFTTSFWRLQSSPAPAESPAELRDVSCVSSTFCIAVGKTGFIDFEKGSTDGLLAEIWNGASWSILTVPTPKSEERGELRSVSCTSSTACIAIGESTKGLLAEHWNGEKWSAEAIAGPKGAKSSQLLSVSCTSACTAVGRDWLGLEGELEYGSMFAERWNGSKWEIESIPSLPGTTGIIWMSVSCGSSTACTAVGSYLEPEKESKPEFYGSFASHWSGSEWSRPETVNVAGQTSSLLRNVSCASSAMCMAVGYESKGAVEAALAESWNGTKWTVEEPPTPNVENPETGKRAGLEDVSCPSSTFCDAVGTYTNSGVAGIEPPVTTAVVVDTWNGSKWSLNPSANAFADGSNSLTAVSCLAAGYCTATGKDEQFEYNPNETVPNDILVENRVLPPPSVETKAATALNETEATLHGGVNPEGYETKYYFEYGTTTSYGSKTAEASAGAGTTKVEVSKTITGLLGNTKYHYRLVATNGGGPVVDGSDLTFTTAAKPSVETKEATSVLATGAKLNGIVNPKRLETTYHFEYGKTTSYGNNVPIPSAGVGAGESNLEESKTITGLELNTTYHFRIVATNSAGTTDGADKTFATPTSPAWRVTSTPNPTGEKTSRLEGDSCSTQGACTAVGYYENSSGAKLALAEVWNGEEWKEQTVAKPSGAKESELDEVSCTSSSACTAVGSYVNSSSVAVPLVERWNGEAWSAQEAPAPSGAKESGLFSVSCASSSACTATGAYVNSSSVYVALAENWNGTSWSVKEAPIPSGAKLSQLIGVSCSAAGECTAVGEYENSAGEWAALADRWNGEKWTLQEPPHPTGATLTWPEDVACASSTMCVIVGLYEPSAGGDKTLAESWNGTTWSIQTTTNPGSQISRLRGVSCTSSTTCTAVGFYDQGEPTEEMPLAENWNGTAWSTQTIPHPSGAPYNKLRRVSCTSSVACAAVGLYNKSKGEEAITLAELYG
jgi:hypothetical protein